MRRHLTFILLLLLTLTAGAQTSRTISLNGRWQAAVSSARPDAYPLSVPVPGVMTQASPAPAIDFNANSLKDDVGFDYVWYATEFDLSTSHDGYPNSNYTHAFLRLRAKYNAQVYLNGVLIGFDPHSTYSHGEFDLTPALKFGGRNRLELRVGSWNTASFPSKDNSAEWWRTSRAPGICDDVTLTLTHSVAVRHLKLLPSLTDSVVVCTARISNLGSTPRKMKAKIMVNDCRHDLENGFYEMPAVTTLDCGKLSLPAGTDSEFTFRVPASKLTPWTPGPGGNPQLYQLDFIVSDDISADCLSETFGYRDIRISGRDVLINGRPTLFRAENVAFQRAINRWADVVFDEAWIRRFLSAVVNDYGFNYLRIHLGHAYSKWYTIADELGLMLQDEWRFMHDKDPLGDDLNLTAVEFRRWIEQNVNHPSIVTWDQENEGNVRLEALKSELRAYDPTRLWGEDDFDARHIYDYSETIVPTPVHTISASRPSTILESCRLWLNEHGDLEPLENFKTSRTASGWGLYFYTPDEIAQLQADIHADLGTFYRSQRIQAWAPFALLSGAVNGHSYFLGNLADSITPKPNMEIMRRLNQSLGASVEMNQAREWYKDKVTYLPGKKLPRKAWLWNDTDTLHTLRLHLALTDADGKEHSATETKITLQPHSVTDLSLTIRTPRREGRYHLRPTLIKPDGTRIPGIDRRIIVARDPAKFTGTEGFGGHYAPFPGSRSVIDNFLTAPLAPEVQTAIIASIEGDLIDKIDAGKKSITVKSSRYLQPGRMLISTRTFNPQGQLLTTKQSESLTFALLPDHIRTRISETLGMVPVDESKITLTRDATHDIYTISMIGRDDRPTIRIPREQ